MNESNQEIHPTNKYSNVLLSEHPTFTKKEVKHQYCFLYFCGIISLFILLWINYFITSASFEANEYVPISIELACNKAVSKYEQCLEKEKEDNCFEESSSVEQCYDSVFSINKNCFIYISEYHLCKSKRRSCQRIASDFIECAHKFPGIIANELLALIN